MKKTFLFLLLTSLFIAPSRVKASECTTQYGGTTTCVSTSLTINKQVTNPATGNFVENLGSTDATFSSNQEVLFRLTIKNTGSQAQSSVTVKDTFPSELTFVSGPGTFDATSNTLTFTLDNLGAGESRSIEVLAKVDANKVNKERSISCVINTSRVSASPPAGGAADQDTAQLCIQTNVLGATTLPIAGFNDFAFLLPFAGLGLAGMALLMKRG